MRTTCLAVLLSLVVTASAAELPEGVRRVKVLSVFSGSRGEY